MHCLPSAVTAVASVEPPRACSVPSCEQRHCALRQWAHFPTCARCIHYLTAAPLPRGLHSPCRFARFARVALLLCFAAKCSAAGRKSLPRSVLFSLANKDWRIESSDHPDSFLFRVSAGADGSHRTICTQGCCADKARVWYLAANELGWASDAGFGRGPCNSPLKASAAGVPMPAS